ncbi:DUF3078 domain-containing protein [Olivibacter sp. XZL3]|uniref:DUF3078 domain-containing protein n=1 Tax=Olivibacter sp. XZL3 TaxID=1735116 RepID=UPI001066E891|nr:DUF3078 domain-containing protein [Olivibacter sp. XZL3]
MNVRHLLVAFFLTGAFFLANAQNYDLNDLRQAPPKNSLPVRSPQMSIHDVEVQDPNLNLKVNYWRNWTAFGINANQASFSDNWQNGGVNSIAVGLTFNTKFDYTRENKNFTSELDLKYGKVKNRDQLARKANDRILWDNKYAIKFAKKWSFFASLTFESQFDKGYQYGTGSQGQDSIFKRISNFLAPGYLTESIGLEVLPFTGLSIRFGTGTARQTFVMDDLVLVPDDPNNPGADYKRFGVDWPKTFRNELAFQIVANLDRNLSENINIKARYAFFANYGQWGDASHRLDATLTARVSRVISVTLNGIGLYDPLQEEAGGRLQTAQSLAIGILYKFPR